MTLRQLIIMLGLITLLLLKNTDITRNTAWVLYLAIRWVLFSEFRVLEAHSYNNLQTKPKGQQLPVYIEQACQTHSSQRFIIWPAHVLIFMKFYFPTHIFLLHNACKTSCVIKCKVYFTSIQFYTLKNLKMKMMWECNMSSWISELSCSLFGVWQTWYRV